MLRNLLAGYRRRGAHRAVRPGARPARLAHDPWSGHPLFYELEPVL
jgi:hypothetical protein